MMRLTQNLSLSHLNPAKNPPKAIAASQSQSGLQFLCVKFLDQESLIESLVILLN